MMALPSPRIAWFLFLPALSRSLDWSPYRLLLDSGESLVDWWVRGVRHSRDYQVVLVVQGSRDELEWALPDGPQSGLAVHFTRQCLQADAIYEAACLYEIDVALLGELPAGIVPGASRAVLAESLVERRADLAYYSDVPRGADTVALTRKMLRILAESKNDAARRSPVAACREVGLLESRWPSPTPSGAISVASNRLPREGGSDDCVLPAEIRFSDPIHRAAFLEVCSAIDASESAVVNLIRWRRAVAERKRRHMQRLLKPHKPVVSPATPRCRVLFVSEQSAYSGAEESLCQCVGALDRTDFELYAFVGCPGKLSRRLQALGVKVRDDHAGFETDSVISHLHWQDALGKIRPDIVHFNALPSRTLLWATAGCGARIVQHLRNGDLTGYEESLGVASAVIAISRYLRNAALAFPIDPTIVSVIPDEVSPPDYPPVTENERWGSRERLGIPESAPVILMIARLAPNKRHDLMLDAFEALAARVPEAHLILKTDYPHKPTVGISKLLDRIQNLKARLNIHLCFFLEEIRPLYCAADVLVLCSDREGLGRCVVEAMSQRVPVIVTDSGGTHEIVEDSVSGLVIPGGSSSALADACYRLLSDSALRERFAERAKRFVEAHLTARCTARALAAVYRRVWSPPHPGVHSFLPESSVVEAG